MISDEALTQAERQLVEAVRAGKEVHFYRGEAGESQSPPFEPDALLRAEVIFDLVVRSPFPANPRGVRIVGAQVEGELDFDFTRISQYLSFSECIFQSRLSCHRTVATSIAIINCRVPLIDAAGLTMSGDLNLRGTYVGGNVTLSGALIGGDLDCRGITSESILAPRIGIEGNLRLDGAASSTIVLDRATIRGAALFARSKVETSSEGNPALTAVSAVVGGNLSLKDAVFNGHVDLRRIGINGDLHLSR